MLEPALLQTQGPLCFPREMEQRSLWTHTITKNVHKLHEIHDRWPLSPDEIHANPFNPVGGFNKREKTHEHNGPKHNALTKETPTLITFIVWPLTIAILT